MPILTAAELAELRADMRAEFETPVIVRRNTPGDDHAGGHPAGWADAFETRGQYVDAKNPLQTTAPPGNLRTTAEPQINLPLDSNGKLMRWQAGALVTVNGDTITNADRLKIDGDEMLIIKVMSKVPQAVCLAVVVKDASNK